MPTSFYNLLLNVENPEKSTVTPFMQSVERAILSVLSFTEEKGLIVTERRSRTQQGALCQILPQVLEEWEKREYRVCYLSLKAVKACLCRNPKARHRDLVDEVLERYSRLPLSIGDMTIERQKYWEKVFIALAMAEMAEVRRKDRVFA